MDWISIDEIFEIIENEIATISLERFKTISEQCEKIYGEGSFDRFLVARIVFGKEIISKALENQKAENETLKATLPQPPKEG